MVTGSTNQDKRPKLRGRTRAVPKFVHLPIPRAKRLKEEWIAKHKIKKSYRAQKRHSAASGVNSISITRRIGNLPHKEAANEDATEHEMLPRNARESPDDSKSHPSQIGKDSPSTLNPSPPSQPSSSKSSLKFISRNDGSKTYNHNGLKSSDRFTPSTQKWSQHPRHGAKPQIPDESDFGREEQERVRSLVRDAYALSSLHIFKSDPFHKRSAHRLQSNNTSASVSRAETGSKITGRGGGESKRGGAQNSGRGRTGVAGTSRGGGIARRGQPDMRKRMGALLAQIEARTGPAS